MVRLAKSLPRQISRPPEPEVTLEDSQEVTLLKCIAEKLANMPKPIQPKDVTSPTVQQVEVLNQPEPKECVHEMMVMPEYPTEITVLNLDEICIPEMPKIQLITATDLPLPQGAATLEEQAMTTDVLMKIQEILVKLKFEKDGTLRTTAGGGGGTGGNFLGGILDALADVSTSTAQATALVTLNSILAALEATLTVTMATASGLGNGAKTVTTAGTAVVLGTSTPVVSVTIKALRANTGNIYVGATGVTAANGFILERGSSVSLDIDNLADIFLNSDVSGEGVSFLYLIA